MNQLHAAFARFLLNCIDKEWEMESHRHYLCGQVQFEPYSMFANITQNTERLITTEHISEAQLTQFLSRNGFTLKNPALLMNKIDRDKDCYISFDEFSKYILPCNNNIRFLAEQRVIRKGHHLERELQELVCHVFVLESKNLHDLELELAQLTKQTPVQNFFSLINGGKPWQDDHIHNFLFNNNMQTDLVKCSLFVQRWDMDNDSEINLVDFLRLTASTFQNQAISPDYFPPPRSVTPDNHTPRKPKMESGARTTWHTDKTFQKSPAVIEEVRYPEVSAFHVPSDDILLSLLLESIERNNKNQSQNIQLEHLFRQVGKAGKNFIVLDDIKDYFQSLGHRAKLTDIMRMFKQFDQNKDGAIDLDEFKQYIKSQYKF